MTLVGLLTLLGPLGSSFSKAISTPQPVLGNIEVASPSGIPQGPSLHGSR